MVKIWSDKKFILGEKNTGEKGHEGSKAWSCCECGCTFKGLLDVLGVSDDEGPPKLWIGCPLNQPFEHVHRVSIEREEASAARWISVKKNACNGSPTCCFREKNSSRGSPIGWVIRRRI